MLTFIFIALYQVAGGPPEASAPIAPPTEQTSSEAPANSVADRNQRRCRVQNVTGSRLGARVCHSQAEEEMLEREAQTFLQDGTRLWDNQSSPGGLIMCDRPGC